MKKTLIAFVLMGLSFGIYAHAEEDVDVPTEELARETVLPKFDRPDNVRNRHVVTAKKVEVGVYYGGNFTEPIYNQNKIGFNAGYHLDEDSAVMFNFAKWMTGLNSQYVPGIEKKGQLDFSRIPTLEYSLWANYEIKSYYGKISLTKKGVANLSLYPIVGVGMTKYSHKSYFGINGGVGQKFYFSSSLALRVDLKMQYQQGPNPFQSGVLQKSQPSNVDPGAFDDKFALGTVLDVGVSYLF